VEALEAKVGIDGSAVTSSLDYKLANKQETLVSGTNIKTITSASLLGSGDLSVQPVCEEKTTSFTAAIHGNYIITGTATVTDPSPSAGCGFTVLVRNGTATIGGTAYAIVGTRVERTYHSGAWANAVWLPIASPGTATQVLTSNGASSAPTFQAASGGSTDLSYTAATRVIASSTGTDATLPLVTTGDAGLAPASGGGPTNFLRADGTWAAPGGGGGGFLELAIADYQGPAVVGQLGRYTATRTGTLGSIRLVSDTLPVGSNVIAELRKNSTTSGNVLSATLQVTTSESATNGQYIGTAVSSFSSTAIAAGDVFNVVLTSVGSTTPGTNVRALLYTT
jgi:hypothetical protein